ncbi:hypothetical protein [Dictyobacter kobayashii]|uniref:Uncharacterized protein n=1 Tax=Dictyobacter kobayashii TaxID=2014872 RepID=A0A402ARR0_9CHLR|nr:hypothetical protein [Dictyobacter kobayashii]GCE21772.1 hypothetical protein KDK_55720 [Dictyobacter kobayashii]
MGMQPTARLMCNIEIAPENEHDADVAVIHEVGRELVSALQQNGYAVASVYKGKPGGGKLFYQVASGNVRLESNPAEASEIVEGLRLLLQAVSPIVHVLWLAGKKVLHAPASLRVCMALGDLELSLAPIDVEDEERIARLALSIQRQYLLPQLPSSQRITFSGRVAQSNYGRRAP